VAILFEQAQDVGDFLTFAKLSTAGLLLHS